MPLRMTSWTARLIDSCLGWHFSCGAALRACIRLISWDNARTTDLMQLLLTQQAQLNHGKISEIPWPMTTNTDIKVGTTN